MSRKTVIRMASTRPVKVSDIRISINPSALNDAVEAMRSRGALRWSIEHDPYCVSLKKSGDAWTEPLEEFESLVVELWDGEPRRVVMKDTEEGYVLMEFPSETLPFSRRTGSDRLSADRLSVDVDLANFDSMQALERFKSAVSADGTRAGQQGRYSVIPDPIITITIPGLVGLIGLAAIYLLGKPLYTGYSNAVARLAERFVLKTVERFGSEKIDHINRKSHELYAAFKEHQSIDARPVLVERILSGQEFDIILLERVSANELPKPVEWNEILNELVERGLVILGAREITMVRDDDGKLRLWYLHTEEGDVISTDDALIYTADKLSQLLESRTQPNLESTEVMGAGVDTRDDGQGKANGAGPIPTDGDVGGVR